MYFKAKRTAALRKLMNAYCDKQSISRDQVAFIYEGQRIREEQTPDEVQYL